MYTSRRTEGRGIELVCDIQTIDTDRGRGERTLYHGVSGDCELAHSLATLQEEGVSPSLSRDSFSFREVCAGG